MMKQAAWVAAIVLAACAAAPDNGPSGWTRDSWMQQAMKTVSSGPFAFAALPYGDGFQLKLTIRTGAVGISSANESIQTQTPEDAQLQAAAAAAAPAGCTVTSVTRTGEGAVATYACN